MIQSILFTHFLFSFAAQLLRVQSPEGTKRIELVPSATIRELYESIHDAFQLDGYNFAVFGERNYKTELASSRSQTIDDYKLKHGDMIYMKPLAMGTSSVSRAKQLIIEIEKGFSLMIISLEGG